MSDGATSARPGGLTVICIFAIALGALGTCCNLWGIGNTVLNDQMQSVSRQMAAPGQTPAMRQANDEMQDELRDYMRSWMPITVSFAFVGLLLSILLLAGGALSLNLKSGGRTLLFVCCGIVPLFDIGRNVVEGIMAWRIQQIMQHAMERVMQVASLEHGGGAAPPAGVMAAAMGVGGAISFTLIAVWVIAKIVYFGVTLFYMRKPEIRALYG